MPTRRSALVRIGSRLVATAAVALTGHAALAQSFHLVGHAPNTTNSRAAAISADGRVVVGGSSQSGPVRMPAFSWTASGGRNDFGLEAGLPFITQARGVSSDGRTIVGFSRPMINPVPESAFIYRGPGTYQEIPSPNQLLPSSVANGVSGDGSIVVGELSTVMPGLSARAFRWTQATGVQELGVTRPNHFLSEARAISRDGSTIVGQSIGPGSDAFVWREGTGMQILPPAPGSTSMTANAVNPDGTIIVGHGSLGRAVMWRHGVMEQLTGGVSFTLVGVNGVSDDGLVVCGDIYTTAAQSRAGVWTPQNGWELLSNYLTRHGVVLPDGFIMGECNAVSADGRTFVGIGGSTTIPTQGFVATIPAPGALVLAPAIALWSPRRRRTQP